MLHVLFVGLIAGAVAGLIVRGKGFGCLLNIIVGVAGAWFGHWLLDELGIFIYSGNGSHRGSYLACVAGFNPEDCQFMVSQTYEQYDKKTEKNMFLS
jgi:uncharacterized membrane protein YeaQ/YmgE (transglycosylase-associated protein family)